MSLLLFADNASSLLASGIGDTDTTATLTPGTGGLFSAPGAGQYALGTFEDVDGNIEIVKITSRTTDSVVIVRAQEGTTALAFASGTRFEQRVTSGMLALFLQKNGSDTLAGTTILSGVLSLGGGGSIQGGELAGTALRSQPGDTSNQILVPIGGPPTAAASVILTKANLLDNIPDGVGVLLTGMIVIWSGLSSEVPDGYFLCNGLNSTPDLRDLFIIGGGGSLPSSGGSNSSETGLAGGFAGGNTGDHVLTLSEIPAHHHDYFGPGGVAGFSSGGGKGWDWGVSASYITNSPSGGATTPQQFIKDAGGGGPHNHSFPAVGDHQHSFQQIPPYRAVLFIMKS